MKRLLTIVSFIALFATILTSCQKEDILKDDITLKYFSFEPHSNEGLQRSVQGVIEGKQVFIRVPNAVNIQAAVPTFVTNVEQTVGFVDNKVVESSSTAIDLSSPTVLRLSTEGAMSEYTIQALKSATILSFGFYAEDNPGVLFKDYAAKITKLNIDIELPMDADISSLIARYTTTDGAIVKYQSTKFESQLTAIDYSNEIALSLTDHDMEGEEIFKVKVGRMTAPVWSQVTLPSFIAESKSAAVKMELNPITQEPYVMIQLTSNDRKAVLAGYNKTNDNWEALGDETGFSVGRVDAISFAFDSKGNVLAAYKDYQEGANVQYASLQKFEQGKLTYVGGAQSSYNRVNNLSVQLDQDDTPYLGYIFARAASPYVNRGTYVESYKNGSWTGQSFSEVNSGIFSKLIKGADGKLYYLVMNVATTVQPRNPSVYKLDNGQWKIVGHPHVGPTAANSLYGLDIDADVTVDGQIYLAYQASEGSTYVSYVVKWDGSVWKQIGDGFPVVVSNVTSSRNNIAVKVHPDGRVFFVYGDNGQGVKVTTFNEETGNWNASTLITSAGGDKYEMRISDQGVPYLITLIDGYPVLYKYDIPGQ